MLTIAEADLSARVRTVRAYHRRTKHRRDGYAAGPETLDWDSQPSPYRHFAGAPVTPLPLVSDGLDAPFAALAGPTRVAPAIADIRAVGGLLELAFGLSAIKESGPDRWALRCNPSSGNLHPTEAYVVSRGLRGIADGVHHYRPAEHALEQRCALQLDAPGLWIGLSSILWREAWKYGERAFRYCQLDIGHALGAVLAACAALGWRAQVVGEVDGAALGHLLGLDRAQDFGRSEREEPEVLLHVDTAGGAGAPPLLPVSGLGGGTVWSGTANRLDPRPMYAWPVIEEVAQASQGHRGGPARTMALHGAVASPCAPPGRLASVILQRRSAQRYDREHCLTQAACARVLGSACSLLGASGLQLLAFVHRVEGLDPGLYVLPGDAGGEARLRAAISGDFLWECAEQMPQLPSLRRLVPGDFRKLLRALTCHQAIAADSAMTLCMLAPLDAALARDPWAYRQLHWQAGMIGQRLYLEAEAQGISGTGIGCFLDDEVHRLLGIEGESFQALYHFALGKARVDERIVSAPAYPGRGRGEAQVPFA